MRDPGNCPVLEAGGRMVYAHPEILKDESDRTCAQALSVLAAAAEDVARAAAEGRPMEPLELTCPVEDCGAVFVLEALSPAEAARRARRARSVRHGAGRQTRKRKGWLLKVSVIFLVVAVVLGGGWLAGVLYLAPELLPPGFREQLKAWGVPVVKENSADPGGRR